MITVGQLAQQFLSIHPQKSPARLAFYHYLKNLCPLDQIFTQEMLDAFYDRALSYQYWQLNKKDLGETIKSDLEAIGARTTLAFDLSQAVHSMDMQVFNLEQQRDFLALLEIENKKRKETGDVVRSFLLNAHEIILVIIKKSGQVQVEVKGHTAYISSGTLHLVRPHTRILYNADLEFESDYDQIITTSTMKIARFRTNGPKVRGQFIQGTGFHLGESFDKPLKEIPELFAAIKNLERFYVNPVTDPYYHQFMEDWEQVVRSRELE